MTTLRTHAPLCLGIFTALAMTAYTATVQAGRLGSGSSSSRSSSSSSSSKSYSSSGSSKSYSAPSRSSNSSSSSSSYSSRPAPSSSGYSSGYNTRPAPAAVPAQKATPSPAATPNTNRIPTAGVQRQINPANKPVGAATGTPATTGSTANAGANRPASPVPNAPAPQARNSWLGPLAGAAAGIGIGAWLFGDDRHTTVNNTTVYNNGTATQDGYYPADGTARNPNDLASGGTSNKRDQNNAYSAAPVQEESSFFGSLLKWLILGALAYWVYRKFFQKKPQLQQGSAASYEPTNAYSGNASTSGSAGTTLHPTITNSTAFLNNAKKQYMVLQTAWEAGDLAQLQALCTDQMHQDLAQMIQERTAPMLHTEIFNLHAEFMEVVDEGEHTIATLRFTGTNREDGTDITKGFEDLWTLIKPVQAVGGWLLAGVQTSA